MWTSDMEFSNSNTKSLIYPNPVNEVLYIESEKYISDVRIVNYIGKVILDESVKGFYYNKNIEFLHSGYYIIEIKYDSHFEFKQFLKL